MEQPPTQTEKGEIEKIVDAVPAGGEDDTRAMLESGALYVQLDKLRKLVKEPLEAVLGEGWQVTDFKHLDGSKFEIIVEHAEKEEERREVVEIPE